MPKIEPGDIVMVNGNITRASIPRPDYLGVIGRAYPLARNFRERLKLYPYAWLIEDDPMPYRECELTLLEKHHAKV